MFIGQHIYLWAKTDAWKILSHTLKLDLRKATDKPHKKGKMDKEIAMTHTESGLMS